MLSELCRTADISSEEGRALFKERSCLFGIAGRSSLRFNEAVSVEFDNIMTDILELEDGSLLLSAEIFNTNLCDGSDLKDRIIKTFCTCIGALNGEFALYGVMTGSVLRIECRVYADYADSLTEALEDLLEGSVFVRKKLFKLLSGTDTGSIKAYGSGLPFFTGSYIFP